MLGKDVKPKSKEEKLKQKKLEEKTNLGTTWFVV